MVDATKGVGFDLAWRAISARERSLDGTFVYGVTAARVFCRPSCAARRPSKEKIRIFDTPAEAMAAGFRECGRCRPLMPDPAVDLVQRVRDVIESRINEELSLTLLASEVSVSPSHLQRVFAKQTGVSPRQYAEALRVDRVKAALRAGQTVTASALEAGLGSLSSLYEKAETYLGMSPGQYRTRGAGVGIGYTVVECALGLVLLAATERGLCFIALGDSDEYLVNELRDEYPRATIVRMDQDFQPHASEVLDYIAGSRRDLPLAVDVKGSAFQMLVWKALQEIPYGETRSYSQVAAAIGKPTARRAVAQACAANRVSLVIPCHRVVRGDGESGGYRWGANRKRRLLEIEHAKLARGAVN